MTLAITLAQARTRVQQLLDDEDGARWTVGTGDFDPSTEIDGALQMAASEAVTTYVSQGGDRLDHMSDYSDSIKNADCWSTSSRCRDDTSCIDKRVSC